MIGLRVSFSDIVSSRPACALRNSVSSNSSYLHRYQKAKKRCTVETRMMEEAAVRRLRQNWSEAVSQGRSADCHDRTGMAEIHSVITR